MSLGCGLIEFEKDLLITDTCICDLKIVDLEVHGDSCGWSKENWQQEQVKTRALGLSDHHWVQNYISFNGMVDVTRGIHAEPWDKLVSVVIGRIFGAWANLRSGVSFGRVFACEVDFSFIVYVPRGVGNGCQAIESGTAYCHFVGACWSVELKTTHAFVDLADPKLDIHWSIPLNEAVVSDADRSHPIFKDVAAMASRDTFVTGCDGQFGRALRARSCEVGRFRSRHARLREKPFLLFARVCRGGSR